MSVVPWEEDSILLAAQHALATLSASSETREAVHDSDQEDSSVHSFTDVIQRLQIWMGDHEVNAGRLDYKLREASHLRERVLEALFTLSSTAHGICAPTCYFVANFSNRS